MNFSQIKETCLYVKDLEATREFYQDRLGLALIAFVEGRHVFFRVGTSVLLCFLPEVTVVETRLPPHFGSGHLHLAFECQPADYEGMKTEVASQGIEILQEVNWPNGVRSFYFSDPDQHLVEIVEVGLWD